MYASLLQKKSKLADPQRQPEIFKAVRRPLASHGKFKIKVLICPQTFTVIYRRSATLPEISIRQICPEELCHYVSIVAGLAFQRGTINVIIAQALKWFSGHDVEQHKPIESACSAA